MAPNPRDLGDTAGHLHSPRVVPGDLARASQEHTLDHTVSVVGTRYFPACFGWESFVKPGGALGGSEDAEGKLSVQ